MAVAQVSNNISHYVGSEKFVKILITVEPEYQFFIQLFMIRIETIVINNY